MKPPANPPIIPPTANTDTAKELYRRRKIAIGNKRNKKVSYKIKVIIDWLICASGFR